MQIFNKSIVKNTLAHTWFIYPVSAMILTVIWLWAFPSFHQPSAHQKINVFFATDVTNEKFVDPILEKYDRENLREINVSYASPTSVGYYQKFKIAINTVDILVLTKSTFQTYSHDYDTFFVPITGCVKSTAHISDERIIDNYGVMLKKSDETNYLSEYMTFNSEEDYVLTFSVTSQNLGAAINEDNAPYDNALTFARFLIEGV